MATGPTTTIDGIRCELLGKTTDPLMYPIVVYKCDGRTMCAYKSNSQGLWRFNISHTNNMKMKGCNYVTTSQIHMGLQCFITEHFDSLPVVEFDSIRDVFYLVKANPNLELIVKEIERCDTNRFVHPVFAEMSNICELCFDDTTSFHKIFTRSAKSDRESRPQNEYTAFLNNLLEKKDFDSAEDFYSSMVKTFSTYMSHFFSVEAEPSTFICQMPSVLSINVVDSYANVKNDPFSFKASFLPPFLSSTNRRENIETPRPIGQTKLRWNMNVFKTHIVLKSSGQKFVVYYATYKMPETDSDGKQANPHYSPTGYKVILNILPAESKMSPLGINDTFINAGVYIYKMFDYANPVRNRQIHRASKGFDKLYDDRYQFAGDLLSQLWPLNEIRETEAPALESNYVNLKGGSRKKSKSKRKTRRQRSS